MLLGEQCHTIERIFSKLKPSSSNFKGCLLKCCWYITFRKTWIFFANIHSSISAKSIISIAPSFSILPLSMSKHLRYLEHEWERERGELLSRLNIHLLTTWTSTDGSKSLADCLSVVRLNVVGFPEFRIISFCLPILWVWSFLVVN